MEEKHPPLLSSLAQYWLFALFSASEFLFPMLAHAIESFSSEQKNLEFSISNFESRLKSFRALPCLAEDSKQKIDHLVSDSQNINLKFRLRAASFIANAAEKSPAECGGKYEESFSCNAANIGQRKKAALAFAEAVGNYETDFDNSYLRNFEQADIYTQDMGNDLCAERGFEERKKLETAAESLTGRFLAFSSFLEGLARRFNDYQELNQFKAANAGDAEGAGKILRFPQHQAIQNFRPVRIPSAKEADRESDITGLRRPE